MVEEAKDLLQRLQKIIENQEGEIKRLNAQLHMYRTQNDRLRNSQIQLKDLSQSPDSRSSPETLENTLVPSPLISGSVIRRKRPGAGRLSSDECNVILQSVSLTATSPPLDRYQHSDKEGYDKDEDDMSVSESVTSSDLSSTEESSVDLDRHSISPPDSPVSVISTLPDTPKTKELKGRRAMSTASTVKSLRMPQKEGEEDVDSKFMASLPTFRSRVSTFGGRTNNFKSPGKTYKRGATDNDAAKGDNPRKLQRSNSFPLMGQSLSLQQGNFLSPDMEMKIQALTETALYKKYGGKNKATKAATVIQTAYRKYQNEKHFKLLRARQRDTMQRRRTMSIKFPEGRRPSMIKRKIRKGNALLDVTVGKGPVDKMVQVKSVYKNITQSQTQLRTNLSRRELHSMSPSIGTASSSLLISEQAIIEHDLPREPTIALSNQLSFIDEIEDEEVTGASDSIHPPDQSRSYSIFAGISSSTIQTMFSSKHPIIIQQKESAVTLRRKTIIGANIFNRNPKKGIQYLVFEGVLEDNPYKVADFLKNYYAISKEKIGEFVGEIRLEFNMAVLECLVESLDLSGKTIDEAIRDFQKLFRMPGEAQKIDKIMQVFASEYYKHNSESVVKSEDAAYVLSFAIMMLHTDLHNPAVKRHMTKQQWIKMNRGTNDDEDFPQSFLLDIYNRIQQTEFETGKDHTHQVMEVRKTIYGHGVPPLSNPQRRFVHKCDVLQLKDIQKRFQRNRRRTLFIFNDVVLVTKPSAAEKYEFKRPFTLFNSTVMAFTTQFYKFGVYLQHEMSGETHYYNCESEGDRTRLITKVKDSILELREMENERIADFAYKGKHSVLQKGSQTVKAQSKAGDLIFSSVPTSTSEQNLHSGNNFGTDMGKALNSKGHDTDKRSSKDSGFDSPKNTSPTPYTSSTLPISSSQHLSPVISNGHHLEVERTRSLSPEPSGSKKQMTVIPAVKQDIAKSKTLDYRDAKMSPKSSAKNQKQKKTNRLSTPLGGEVPSPREKGNVKLLKMIQKTDTR